MGSKDTLAGGTGSVGGGREKEGPGERKEGPGDRFVGAVGLGLGLLYMVVVTALILYGLFVVWPHPTPAMAPREGPGVDTVVAGMAPPEDTAGARLPAGPREGPGATEALDTIPGYAWCIEPDSLYAIVYGRDAREQVNDPKCASFLGYTFTLWDEQRLLLIVMLAGALGSLLHGLRSFGWYAGNRTLKWSWAPFYMVLPFTGALLGILFYVIVRGGFFAPGSGFSDTSPFGFASLAALVGLFSAQAMVKLQQVAETLLAKPDSGKDAVPQGSASPGSTSGAGPSIAGVEVTRASEGRPSDLLRVTGSGFERDAVVTVDGKQRDTLYVSAAELVCTLVQEDVDRLDADEPLSVAVENPAGARSKAVQAGP